MMVDSMNLRYTPEVLFCQTAAILAWQKLWRGLLKCVPTGSLYPRRMERRCSVKRSLRLRYVSPVYILPHREQERTYTRFSAWQSKWVLTTNDPLGPSMVVDPSTKEQVLQPL